MKLIINKEATLNNVHGSHTNRAHKPVLCITTKEKFASVTDAAEACGVAPSVISAVCNGRIKTCKGKEFCFIADRDVNLDKILSASKDYEELARKAALWDAYQAEQEKKRKLAESLQQAVDKAQKTLELKKRIREEQEAKCQKANEREMEAEAKLAKLQNMSLEEWAVSHNNPSVRQAESNRRNYEKSKAKKNEN